MKALIFCLLSAAALLCGCASTPSPPVSVPVPVVKPLPDLPDRPPLMVEKLRRGDSAKKALDACGQDLNMLLQREEMIKKFLSEYKK